MIWGGGGITEKLTCLFIAVIIPRPSSQQKTSKPKLNKHTDNTHTHTNNTCINTLTFFFAPNNTFTLYTTKTLGIISPHSDREMDFSNKHKFKVFIVCCIWILISVYTRLNISSNVNQNYPLAYKYKSIQKRLMQP